MSNRQSELAKAPATKPATIWWCERCHASGVENLGSLPVWDAIAQLTLVHDGHALAKMRACEFSTATVRVEEAAIAKVTGP